MLGENGKSWRIRRQASNGRRMREGDRRESTEMRKIGWERKYKTVTKDIRQRIERTENTRGYFVLAIKLVLSNTGYCAEPIFNI